MIIKILPEPTTRVAGLETGEIDYLLNNVPVRPVRDRRRAWTTSTSRSCPRTTASGSPSTPQSRRSTTCKVRQALNYAVDKVGLRQLYYGPDTPGHQGDARLPHAVDVRGGRSGRRPGTRCRPTTRTWTWRASCSRSRASPTSSTARPSRTTSRRPRSRASASRSSTSMGQLGITIEAQKITYQEAIALQFGAHDDYDIIVGAWGSDFPDPSGNLRPNFASENIVAGGANASAYTNPAGRRAAPAAERARSTRPSGRDLLIEAQALIAEDCPDHLGHQPGLAAGGQQAGPGRRGRAALVLGLAVQGRLGHRVAEAPAASPRAERGDAALGRRDAVMAGYAARRLLAAIPILLFVSFITFGLIRLAPGRPGAHRAGRHGASARSSSTQLREQFGLDGDPITQYVAWLGRVIQLDLGESYKLRQEVGDLIARRDCRSRSSSIALAVLLAILDRHPLGVLQARRRESAVDYAGSLLRLRRASARRSTSRPSWASSCSRSGWACCPRSGSGERPLRPVPAPAAARGRAGAGHDRAHLADDPQRHARGAGVRLHRGGARQGPAGAHDPDQARRCATRSSRCSRSSRSRSGSWSWARCSSSTRWAWAAWARSSRMPSRTATTPSSRRRCCC